MARTPAAYSTASQAPMLQRVWQSMRILRRFDTGQLQATAEAGETAVAKYVKALRQAGYLRVEVARVSGRPGSRDQLALVRNSGPLAPIRRRDSTGVFDPNTRCVWGLDGKLLEDAPPPAPPALPQAAREALRQLATIGSAKLSGETLAVLLRHGLVQVSTTAAGRALAQGAPEPKTQRHGRELASAVPKGADHA